MWIPTATAGAHRHTRRTFLIPSIPDLVFAGLACLQVAAASLILLNRDGDLPRHITIGTAMLENRAVVRADFFLYTAYGQPFLPTEWGSELIFAALYQFAGLDAVAAFTAVVIAAAYALLAGLLIRRGLAADLVLLTVGLAVLIGMPYWAARPHAFSLLFAAILLRLLEPGKPSQLLMVAGLFCLWANLHPGFLFGLGILALATVGDVIEAATGDERPASWRAARYHAAALGLGGLATLLNPFGIGLHLHLLRAVRELQSTPAIVEWAAPDFHTSAGLVFLGTLLLVVAALCVRRSRIAAPTLLILLATLALSLQSRRHVALFGIVTLPLIAIAVGRDWERWIPAALRAPGRSLAYGDRLARRGGLALAVIVILALLVLSPARSRPYIATEFDARTFPIAAVNFARTAGVTGTLYNAFTWGGYLTLAWPEQQIFIDGLVDFYGPQILQDYQQVARLRPGWREVLDRWKVTLVLDRADSDVGHELSADPAWVELYRDEVAVLLQRKSVAE